MAESIDGILERVRLLEVEHDKTLSKVAVGYLMSGVFVASALPLGICVTILSKAVLGGDSQIEIGSQLGYAEMGGLVTTGISFFISIASAAFGYEKQKKARELLGRIRDIAASPEYQKELYQKRCQEEALRNGPPNCNGFGD